MPARRSPCSSQVVGFRLHGQLRRRDGDRPRPHRDPDPPPDRVVGEVRRVLRRGLAGLPLADRATIGNMSPSTGRPAASSPSTRRRSATCASPAAAKARRARRGVLQGEPLARPGRAGDVLAVVELDLSEVEPSLAGPRRPRTRIALSAAKKQSFRETLPPFGSTTADPSTRRSPSRSPRRPALVHRSGLPGVHGRPGGRGGSGGRRAGGRLASSASSTARSSGSTTAPW